MPKKILVIFLFYLLFIFLLSSSLSAEKNVYSLDPITVSAKRTVTIDKNLIVDYKKIIFYIGEEHK